MDQTRPMEAGKEVKCSKGKRGRREAGQVMMLLRLMAPGGPADFIVFFVFFGFALVFLRFFWFQALKPTFSLCFFGFRPLNQHFP